MWLGVCWLSAFGLHASQSATAILVEDLLQSVARNDSGAYYNARSAALGLGTDEFAKLLNALSETDSWRALAIHNALRIRRDQPALATDFDERLERVRNTPVQTRAGNWRYVVHGDGRFLGIPEHDALRLEAILTENAELPDGQLGLADPRGWAAFRIAVYVPPLEMKARILMLQDKPEWLPYAKVVGAIYGKARSNPGSVDAHVSELTDLYMALRRDNKAYPSLLRAIAEADTALALPALIAIRNYEVTVEMPRRMVEPWESTEDEIRAELDRVESQLWKVRSHRIEAQRIREATRVGELSKEVEELEMQLESLRSMRGSQRLWDTLNELIEEHQKGDGT
jgi:hypothetical protein